MHGSGACSDGAGHLGGVELVCAPECCVAVDTDHSVASDKPGGVDAVLERDRVGDRLGLQTPWRSGWARGTRRFGNVSFRLRGARLGAGGTSCLDVAVSLLQPGRVSHGQPALGEKHADAFGHRFVRLRVSVLAFLTKRHIALITTGKEALNLTGLAVAAVSPAL